MAKKLLIILRIALPVIIMIALIPYVRNDFTLAVIDLAIALVALLARYAKNDLVIFVLGFLIMILSEAFFISTGVEVFIRRSLFGIMPLWLPILWAYAFVAIKRSVRVIEN